MFSSESDAAWRKLKMHEMHANSSGSTFKDNCDDEANSMNIHEIHGREAESSATGRSVHLEVI